MELAGILGYDRICRYLLGLKLGLGPSPCRMQKSEYPLRPYQ